MKNGTPNLRWLALLVPLLLFSLYLPAVRAAPQMQSNQCNRSFLDVHRADWFHDPVINLACAEIVNGYADGTFRPYNSVTRGQVAKMVVVAMAWTLLDVRSPRFRDVPLGSTFSSYIETAASRGVINGYTDGTYRPNANVTRGQLTKILTIASQWSPCANCSQRFSDVPPGNPFFSFVEVAAQQGLISGYSDGSFRPSKPATR
jgi:hypothetical protein